MSTVQSPIRPAALVRGFLGGGVTGATLSAFVTAIVLENGPLVLFGLGLPVGYGVLLFLAGLPRRAREKAVVPRVALARIESLRAGSSETGDVPLGVALTIAPGDAPPFRVEITHRVNLVDLPRYQAGDVLVVRYPPDRPWRAEVVPHPTAEWERRASGAIVQSAPESAVVRQPSEGGAFSFAVFVGLLLGVAAVVALFRVELFTSEPVSEPSSSSTTTTVTTQQSVPDAEELPGRRICVVVSGPEGSASVVVPPR